MQFTDFLFFRMYFGAKVQVRTVVLFALCAFFATHHFYYFLIFILNSFNIKFNIILYRLVKENQCQTRNDSSCATEVAR